MELSNPIPMKLPPAMTMAGKRSRTRSVRGKPSQILPIPPPTESFPTELFPASTTFSGLWSSNRNEENERMVENGKAEKAKKVKPKKPKVSVSNATAKIDADDLSDFLVNIDLFDFGFPINV
nr:hypothetical protein CFP56_23660 [Quercus suber]